MFTLDQDGPQSSGRATSALIVQLSSGTKGPRPHIVLPLPILSVWRIEGNGFGNVLLTIVNDLVTIVSFGARRKINPSLCCQQLGRHGAPSDAQRLFSPGLWKARREIVRSGAGATGRHLMARA